MTVDFGPRRVIDDVSLAIGAGEWAAMIGARLGQEHPHRPDRRAGHGELSFGSKFRALPPDPVLDARGAIEFFGFAGLERVSPWELSQGGRQWLALAALLVGAPGVLVLDEPTTGQDALPGRPSRRLRDWLLAFR